MQPKIENLPPKKLIGQNITMSLIENKTVQLWSQFAPRIGEIKNRIGSDKISLQVYPSDYYAKFIVGNQFQKWALVEVENFSHIPKGMESFELQAGLYAVFDYKGSSNDSSIYQYIFNEWIPNSGYIIDHRPHFEVLGANYRNNDSNSEEEIWIPIREK